MISNLLTWHFGGENSTLKQHLTPHPFLPPLWQYHLCNVLFIYPKKQNSKQKGNSTTRTHKPPHHLDHHLKENRSKDASWLIISVENVQILSSACSGFCIKWCRATHHRIFLYRTIHQRRIRHRKNYNVGQITTGEMSI